MIPQTMKVGSETPVQVGMVCAAEDYNVLTKLKKYLIPALNAIAGKRISIQETLASDSIEERLAVVLKCEVLLIILSIDLLCDYDFIRRETGLADRLISQIELNTGSIAGIYILARNVDISHIPQPKNDKIMILPLNQIPLTYHENEDDAYIMLCKHIALEIQHLRDQQTIKKLEDKIKLLEEK